jgi:hypothetical protein
MLVGAALCPHPPALLPALAAGAAPELDTLRAACDAAVTSLTAAQPTVVVVVGAAETVHGHGGTFAAYGDRTRVGSGPPTLPLPHTVGCWLLDRAGWTGRRAFIGPDDDVIAGSADRVALLVMGDASARRTEKAPGYIDERAAGYDAEVARAFATGPQAIAQLDGELATELLAVGWPAWQLLARVAADAQWDTRLTYDAAPFGVGYLVAEWARR